MKIEESMEAIEQTEAERKRQEWEARIVQETKARHAAHQRLMKKYQKRKSRK